MAKSEAKGADLRNAEVLTGEFAAIVGKSPQWIRQLTRDGVLKQTSRGRYRLSESVQRYIEHVQGAGEDDGKPSYMDEKTEHERVKKEIALLELAKMRADLHDAADVEATMNDMLTAFRQKILVLPTKLAPQLVGLNEYGSIKAKLMAACNEALTELSNYNPESFVTDYSRADADEDG